MKLLFYILIFLTGLNGYGQKEELLAAWEYLKKKDYPNAQTSIEKAINNDPSRQWAQTWYYRGMIYETILSDLQNKIPDNTRVETMLVISQSYDTALKLDTTVINSRDLLRRHNGTRAILQKEGLAFNQSGNFDHARRLFLQCVAASRTIKELDTLSLFNAAISCQKLKNYPEAIIYLTECASYGYGKGGTYTNLSILYKEQGDDEKNRAIISEGRRKFPKDINLILSELNLYLQDEKRDSALILLDESIKTDPKNSVLYYSRGSLCEEYMLADTAQIINDYKKSIALNGYYFEPHYNLGAHYYNSGALLQNASLDPSKNKESEEMKARAIIYFNLAVNYLETAYKIRAKDPNVVTGLKDLYQRLDRVEDYERLMKLHP